MIVYRCDHCGEPIGERLRITTTTGSSREGHFCSVPCVTEWGRWSGYYKPDDGVIEAWVYCGATYPNFPDKHCRFVDGHTGTHVTYGGLEWTQVDR